jgi:hypothetical protein
LSGLSVKVAEPVAVLPEGGTTLPPSSSASSCVQDGVICPRISPVTYIAVWKTKYMPLPCSCCTSSGVSTGEVPTQTSGPPVRSSHGAPTPSAGPLWTCAAKTGPLSPLTVTV